MFIYAGKSYYAAATGAIIKHCACEKCGAAYQYQMVRRGQGAASAPYYINTSGAEKRAQQRANRNLAKLLEKGIDPVACPDCGWFQAAMVREMRQRKHRWLLWPGWVALGLGLLIFSIQALVPRLSNSRVSEQDKILSINIALITLLATVTPFAIRWLLLRMCNPNARFPDKPDPIPGMPRAFKAGEELPSSSLMVELEPERGDPVSGAPALQYERRPPLVSPGGWVTVQLLSVQFPRTCCSCLQPTNDAFRYNVGSSTSPASVQVRICTECRRSINRMKNGLVICAMVIFAGIFAVLVCFGVRNPMDRNALMISTAIGGALLGGLVGYFFTIPFRPVRFRSFSSKFNTLRIRFRNEAYTGSFADANEMT